MIGLAGHLAWSQVGGRPLALVQIQMESVKTRMDKSGCWECLSSASTVGFECVFRTPRLRPFKCRRERKAGRSVLIGEIYVRDGVFIDLLVRFSSDGCFHSLIASYYSLKSHKKAFIVAVAALLRVEFAVVLHNHLQLSYVRSNDNSWTLLMARQAPETAS